MKIRTKFLALLTMVVSLFLAGCLNNKDGNDSANGVKVLRDRNSVTVVATSDFAGALITVNGTNSSSNVKFENGNIGIVSKKDGESTISVIKPNGEVKADEILFRVENVENKVSVKLEDEISTEDADKEIAKSAKKLARAAGDVLVGDFDGNGVVGLEDFTAFSTAYVAAYNVKYDIAPAAKASADSNWVNIYSKSTPDGAVDILDFVIFGRNYGKTNPDVTVSAVAITGETTVEVGKTVALGVTVTYSNGQTDTSGAGVTWSSSDATKATVNAGTVSGVAAGTATITATKDGKSGTLSLTVKEVATAIKIYYKASSAPTIWLWEDGGRAILKLEGLTWDTQPTMTASATPGWYEYTIPAKYYPLTKRIGVQFNKGAQVFTTGIPTASVWYDGTNWYDKNPDGPKAPTIALSGAGTFVAGTYNVTVNVSGDSITAIKYTKDGSTPSATNGTTVANGGTIPVTLTTGATVTVKVYAENAVGSTTAEAVLKEGQPVKAGFSWRNALVYFVLTDRFYNGDTSNDNSYNRKNSSDLPSVATFHGGDIKGLTQKLDYLDSLGVNAIWITAPYEQIHGWVSGKNQAFPHYAFHGYYAQDWTFMDKNMGTVEEFRTFVNEAHKRGIRVVMDIVMNHTGYNTTEDMITYGFGKTTQTQHGWIAQTNGKWDANVGNDWTSSDWGNWWGSWVRAFGGKFGFAPDGISVNSDPLKGSLAGLPDFVTEATGTYNIPEFLKNKWAAEDNSTFDNWRIPAAANYRKDGLGAPADYLVKWLSAWVEEFGIDGFRCDTAKHVDLNRWKQLKDACKVSLNNWRASSRATGDAKYWTDDFWMTGEAWGLQLSLGNTYHTQGGFDSMINFSFNPSQGGTGRTPTTSDWATYASQVNVSQYNVLSYVSSHDTGLCRPTDMKQLGTMLVLLPGGVQIFYGDETGRPSIDGKGDTDMATRGDMNWDAINGDVANHWKKVGTFRKNHVAVGAGTQTDLGSNTYGRTYSKDGATDKVVINVGGSGSVSVNVSGIFADGASVRNAYDGATGTVSGGKVTFTATNGVILIEENK